MQLGDQLSQAMLRTRARAPPGESARAPQAVPTPLQLPVTQQPPSPPHIPKDTRLRGALQYGDWLPVVPALAGPTLPWTPTERHHRTHHQKSFPPSPAGVKTAQSAEQQNPQHTYYWQARGAAPHRLPPARAPPTPGEVQGWRGHTVLQPRGPRQSPALGVSVTHDLLVRMALPRVPRPLRAALAQSEPPPHTTEVSWGSWGRARG